MADRTGRPPSLRLVALTWKLRAALALGAAAWAQGGEGSTRPWGVPGLSAFSTRRDAAKMLLRYFERMCEPKPFVVRAGAELRAHRQELRRKLLECAGLWPLPDRLPLDVHRSEAIEHEWCTVRRVTYQLWPHVYSSGLLYMPTRLIERPAPAVLCPHGHWPHGNAHPEVQTRCLVLAKLGYIVFSPTQNHYEDPALGISHQTLMIWNNIRALDYLASLPEVDHERIGGTGGSGGGLQTQMLVAVDDRVKAATIVGMTCDYREIVFAGRAHCGCNHFPNIMRYTDQPEISALGLPAAVQFLAMNDWTRAFQGHNYPTVRRLYAANGLTERTDCHYWPVGHSYGKAIRERMVGWMEKWLRGKDPGGPVPEPETKTLPVKMLLSLKADVPENKGFGEISRHYTRTFRYATPRLRSRRDWEQYRTKMRHALLDLLGRPAGPPRAAPKRIGIEKRDGLVAERLLCASEKDVLVPVVILRPSGREGKLPAVVMCHDGGKQALLSAANSASPQALARAGAVVALPDVRFTGELSLKAIAGLSRELLTFEACSPLGEGRPQTFGRVWERNAMLWGRPIPGMAATDIRAVARCIAARVDVDSEKISLRARGKVALAALFGAALQDHIAAVELDLEGRCFARRDLPLVPFVLRHGDVLQWAALLADRRLTLAGVPAEAGDTQWLRDVFGLVSNRRGLRLKDTQ